MRKILLVLLPVAVLLTSCDLFTNYGKKVTINDKNSVYYKGDGVSEADAKKLGDYLAQIGIFDGKDEKAVQLSKNGDAYVVRIPIKEDVVNKDRNRFETIFWFQQDLMSENVFDGKKTRIILTDSKFKDKTSLDEMQKVAIGKSNHVYFKGSGIKEKDAQNIGDSLLSAKFFDYTTGDILLTKEKGNYVIRFLPNEQQQKNTSLDYNIVLENYKYIISKYILGGDDVELIVIDNDFNEVKTVKDPPDSRKLQIDQVISGQQQQQTDPYGQQNDQYSNDDNNQTPVDNNYDQQ